MKYLLFIFLAGCSYNDCLINRQIKSIDNQLKIENTTMAKILNQEWTQDVVEQIAEEMDVIESLEVQKMILQNQKCL